MSTNASKNRFDAIHDAIQATREEPLKDWAAIAVWEDGDPTVLGEAPLLQLKGYLHSGLWQLAHTDGSEPAAVALEAVPGAADVREFPKGSMHVVRIHGGSIGRGTFEPGWKWSESVGPIIERESCPLEHVGVVLKGAIHIVMDSGEEFDIKAGEAIRIEPGHDAWTIGDEDCEVLEVLSAEQYAKPQA